MLLLSYCHYRFIMSVKIYTFKGIRTNRNLELMLRLKDFNYKNISWTPPRMKSLLSLVKIHHKIAETCPHFLVLGPLIKLLN